MYPFPLVAAILLGISCGTSFFTIGTRLLRWQDTMDTANVPTRLVMCLAFSDCIGSLAWFLEAFISIEVGCPPVMVFVYYGFLSSCLFTNCIGFHLVFLIHKKKVQEKYYYILGFFGPMLPVIIFLSISGSYQAWKQTNICWLTYVYDIVFWRALQLVTFLVNAVLFGYVTHKILTSRKTWQDNDEMRDKEKRLYLLIICFFVPTCGGILNIFKHPKIVNDIGVYLICAQGLLNSIAVNEKLAQDALQKFLQKSACGYDPPPDMPPKVACRQPPSYQSSEPPSPRSSDMPDSSSASSTYSPMQLDP
jgi:hypothetical protein